MQNAVCESSLRVQSNPNVFVSETDYFYLYGVSIRKSYKYINHLTCFYLKNRKLNTDYHYIFL